MASEFPSPPPTLIEADYLPFKPRRPLLQPLLSVEHASAASGGNTLLQDISLTVSAGEIVTLLGPNGAGKTTLLRAILGMQPLNSGRIGKADHLRIGYVPQRLEINPYLPLTVYDFLHLGQRCTKEEADRALHLFDAVRLREYSMHRLSGGERQRVLLARAMLRRPHLLLLDEPVQGMDITGQSEFYARLGELRNATGCALLMVSHDLHLVMSATDRVLCLNTHICCAGEPEQISRDPAFLSLFGPKAGELFALYQHHHDHRHDLYDENGGHRCAEHEHD